MHKGPRGSRISLVGTINVTPFIDVLLVLLALTIVFASDLPGMQAANSGDVSGALSDDMDDAETLVLEVAGEDALVLAGTAVNLATLEQALATRVNRAGTTTVVNIVAAKTVDYDLLFSVLTIVNKSDAGGITFSIYE